MKGSNIAILQIDDFGDQVSDDHLLVEELQLLGHTVCAIDWRADINWSDFDLALIRGTWDYHLHLDEFIMKMSEISASTILLNPLSIIEWNSNKKYLSELERNGVSIVPTIFHELLDESKLNQAFIDLDSEKIIVKPQVSANSLDTIITRKGDKKALQTFNNRPCMIQPFIDSINTIGEYSVYFFEGEYSHAIIKKPASGDFRVQEDFGGTQEEIDVDEKLMIHSKQAVKDLPKDVFYARVDSVLHGNEYQLMELELIEPGMYFRYCNGSAKRFAKCIDKYLQNN